jgi:hypothetical protein
VDQGYRSAGEGAPPGELMRLVAGELTASGLDVRPPDCHGGCRLTIGCPGARCSLSVSDCGDVEWECCPQAGGEADPKRLADVATTLLTGHTGEFPRQGQGYERPGITLKGIVGLELQARGFDVDLEVYEDGDYFDALADIVVTTPATAHEATVRVTDDGSVTWARDYWPEAATITWEPEYRGWITDPAKVASAVAQTITQAMSQAGLTGQAPAA